jgi:hypothetical protein
MITRNRYWVPRKLAFGLSAAMAGMLLLLSAIALADLRADLSAQAPHRLDVTPAVAVTGIDRPRTLPRTLDTETPPRGDTPFFTSLAQYCDPSGVSFWYPNGWAPLDMSNNYGVTLAPVDGERGTWFSIESSTLNTTFTEDDLPLLITAFHGTLTKLPEFQIQWQDTWVIGTMIGLEAKFTFSEGNAMRKRWTRLLVDGNRQFYVVAQGASPEDYAYWEPMLFQMMSTVVVDTCYYGDEGNESTQETPGESA